MAPLVDEHLPALFRAADRAAISAQQSYLQLVRFDLLLIVLSTVTTEWYDSSGRAHPTSAVIGAVSIFVSLILTLYILQTIPDRRWFGSRAIAESVKTLAWRYMMAAEPFQLATDSQAVDVLFAREIRAVLRDRRSIGGSLGGDEATDHQVTQYMRQLRSQPLANRKEAYFRDRIQDQQNWYGLKAHSNRSSARQWLIIIAVTQLLCGVAAVALVAQPGIKYNIATVLATMAATFVAWLQLKKHQELASSYALAAHELGFVQVAAPHVVTEESFSSFVSDAESAISREHTMWVARRDVAT